MSAFKTLPNQVSVALRRLTRAIDGIVPSDERSWTCRTCDLNVEAPSFIKEVAGWAGKDAVFIYYFEARGAHDPHAVAKLFSNAKKQHKRFYSRLNSADALPSARASSCFYVGGSKNISRRIKEHLGYGAKTTYALQLAHWAHNLEMTVKIVVAKYRDESHPEVYCSLEDALWDQLKPMFGRKGRR